MVFLDYDTIDIPVTNSSSLVDYTTSYKCLVHFEPIESRMEDDSFARCWVEGYYRDTDTDDADLTLFNSSGTSDFNQTVDNRGLIVVPSGKNIRVGVGDSSDRIGGTLYVFRLPEAE
jgi:hypothetical protein